jgi:hypothetical protein
MPILSAADAKLLDASVGSIAGSCGISAFIKQELVADGARSPSVPFPVDARHRKRNQSSAGLQRGRRVDAEFARAVSDVSVPASKDAAQILRALRMVGITAVRAQQRVFTKSNMLTTLVDGVGVTTSNPRELWCIEVKTTMLAAAGNVYNKYAMTACRRKPCLRTAITSPNTERARHCIQAAYGALGLQGLTGRPCRAVVVVLTIDSCLAHVVPRLYHAPSLFTRLPRVLASAASSKPIAAKPVKAKSISDVVRWCPKGTAIIAHVGLALIRPQLCEGIYRVQNKSGHAVGVVGYVPKWATMGDHRRRQVHAKFASVARRKLPATRAKLTPYVVAALTHNGRLQLSVGGRPI